MSSVASPDRVQRATGGALLMGLIQVAQPPRPLKMNPTAHDRAIWYHLHCMRWCGANVRKSADAYTAVTSKQKRTWVWHIGAAGPQPPLSETLLAAWAATLPLFLICGPACKD